MDFEITIIGSGVVGSVLASLLATQGVEVCLIDRQDPFKNNKLSKLLGRTSALNLASIGLLNKLEIWNNLCGGSTDFERIYVWDSEGSSKLVFSAEDIEKKKLGSVISNNYILKEVLGILKRTENIELKFNRTLKDISVDDNSVQVITEDEEKITSKLLVGADGSMSMVRKLSQIPTRTWSYDQTAFVTSLKSENPHESTAWQIFTPSGPIALLPFDQENKGNISLVWSEDNESAERIKSLDDNNFTFELEKRTESILGDFELKDEVRFFPLNQLHAKHYFSNRQLLIGDAAHTIHPLAGQGLNLGLSDVLSLYTILLSARRKGDDIGANKTLLNYENSRKIPNLTMTVMMELFKQGFGNSSPWITLGRNTAFMVTQESAWLKKKFIKEAAGLT